MRKEGQNQRDEKKETNVIASDDGLYIYMASYTQIKLYQESINKGKFEKIPNWIFRI